MNSRPPIAKRREKKMTIHNDVRTDAYSWMRLTDEQKTAENPDQQTAEVLDYLRAENAYLKEQLKATQPLQDELYREITARIKQDDQSVPVTINGYAYYIRYEKGENYPLYCRKKNTAASEEEVLLNGPEMGNDQAYFSIGDYEVSEDNTLIAYSVDLVSRRQYTIAVKDLSTGRVLPDRIADTTGEITWANDNKTIFYVKQDPVTLRSHQVFRHRLGTPTSEDVLVYEEKDSAFSCSVYRSKSKKYLIIGTHQTRSDEYRFLAADRPEGEWTVVQPRMRDLEYAIDHFDDHFYILTNYKAANFCLMKTPVHATEKEHWTTVIAHRQEVLLEGIDLFKDYLVVTEREKGLLQLRVIKWADRSEHSIAFHDPTYTVNTAENPEFDTPLLRFHYTSLTTPNTVYDYNLETRERTVMKQQEVLGGTFSRENYRSERLFTPSRDGKAAIPISIVYKEGSEKDGPRPLLLYGYGAYGVNIDPWFSLARLSLLDRGFLFAIAHVRGGQEMGREWYETGKLREKKNTFYDFIDCCNYLISNRYTSSEHLYAQGGSAGGLLMGALVNEAPDLCKGVIANVPFVDVVSTMLDTSIPLTSGEFDEWGNPEDEADYAYIKSYSPYDNVERKAYPHLLITTGFWDSQVQYWEPAKWIAKLRHHKTNDALLLMHCDMDVGHGGTSGRLRQYREVALEYAFLLHLEQRARH